MDDIIYERDYRIRKSDTATERSSQIFAQAVKGGFFKTYKDRMDKIPKIIVPKDKENYEYLLERCDEFVNRYHGRIKGIVDYHQWHSEIVMLLPFAEFSGKEDLAFLREISEKSHSVTFEPCEDGGVRVRIFICYFDELISEDEKAYLKYEAIEQDVELAVMLGLPSLSPYEQEVALRMKALLDRFENETNIDRTTVFRAVLDKLQTEPKEKHTLEHMESLTEALLYKVLEDQINEDDE